MPIHNSPRSTGAALALAVLCLGVGILLGRQQLGVAVTAPGGEGGHQDLQQQLSRLELMQQQGRADAFQQQRLLELLLALDRRQQAISLLEQWLDQQPQRWGLRLLLAEQRRATGDRSGASRDLRQLLRTMPDQIEVLRLYALLQLEQGRPRDALQPVQSSFERLIKGQPRPEALATGLLLGELLQRQASTAQAEALLNRLAVLFPADPRPLLARALLQHRRGDIRAAQNSLAQARTLNPAKANPRLDEVASAWGLAALRAPSRSALPVPLKPDQPYQASLIDRSSRSAEPSNP